MSRHPLHPALVHFPIACWSLAVVADFTGLWLGEVAWRWSGGLFAVGCGMAFVAMLTGLIELSHVPEGPAMRTAYWHMGAVLVACTLFCTRLLLRLEDLRPLEPNTISLLMDAGGFICLVGGGWLGGKLVYHHGVGRSSN
ncbi:DUF2231 domain-containing protein [Ralstonia sp. SET104]|uniref:DUF2231 domain-containing protein n=1 Tax=Ralstonia sp. SET104 TaxID=2448774 RepID=UPI000F586B7B|nr:DUF2231 domain-containing protein [Ralstonia sp. SET104]GCB05224.1 hypothetical protein PSUB009319_28550 [Ralstonia sp. SET104]